MEPVPETPLVDEEGEIRDAPPAPLVGVAPDGWAQTTQFVSTVLKLCETQIWPEHGPLIELEPIPLPLLYRPPSGEEDPAVLNELMFMLTVGLQGKAFEWRYRIDFEVWWDAEEKAYCAALTSIIKPGFTPPVAPDDFTPPRIAVAIHAEKL